MVLKFIKSYIFNSAMHEYGIFFFLSSVHLKKKELLMIEKKERKKENKYYVPYRKYVVFAFFSNFSLCSATIFCKAFTCSVILFMLSSFSFSLSSFNLFLLLFHLKVLLLFFAYRCFLRFC